MEEGWQAIPVIPRETQRRARAVFSSGSFYLRVGNRLPEILAGVPAGDLLDGGQNAHGPLPVLALVTLFQASEALSDTQASDAIRTRIDWQYALHLPPDYPGLRRDELCLYRQTLFASPARSQAFRRLAEHLSSVQAPAALEVFSEAGCDVLNTVCLPNRLAWALDAHRQVLWALASRWPDVLKSISLPHWYTSYWTDEPLFSAHDPAETESALLALGRQLAADVRYLLDALARYADVYQAQEVQALERIWRQQFENDAHGEVIVRHHCSFCGHGRPTGLLEGL